MVLTKTPICNFGEKAGACLAYIFSLFILTILVIMWCKGALRKALGCPKVIFTSCLIDFGSLIGVTFGSLSHIFGDLRCPKVGLDCRSDS